MFFFPPLTRAELHIHSLRQSSRDRSHQPHTDRPQSAARSLQRNLHAVGRVCSRVRARSQPNPVCACVCIDRGILIQFLQTVEHDRTRVLAAWCWWLTLALAAAEKCHGALRVPTENFLFRAEFRLAAHRAQQQRQQTLNSVACVRDCNPFVFGARYPCAEYFVCVRVRILFWPQFVRVQCSVSAVCECVWISELNSCGGVHKLCTRNPKFQFETETEQRV